MHKSEHSKAVLRLLWLSFVSLGVLASIIVLSGCTKSVNISVTTPQATISPKGNNDTPTPEVKTVPSADSHPQETTDPRTVTTQNDPVKSVTDSVIKGTFIYPETDPMNIGIAEISKKGINAYHLHVSIVHGISHSLGDIESDFTFDGKRFVLSGDEYANVNLSFTENSINIDYPGKAFGGFNAEPKGTFYLENSGIEDAPFLIRLYDTLKMGDPYRFGFSDVYTYTSWDQSKQKQLLLVRSRSSVNRSRIVTEFLAVYDSSDQSFHVLDDVDDYHAPKIRKELDKLKVDPETKYKVLHKDYYDRFIQLQMDKFDHGTLNRNNFSLTDQEAFYILTGETGITSITENHRNSKNIGSIFVIEVDHTDAKTVTIHKYENVRNSETDIHNSTQDWLEVDRSTGKVTSSIFD